MNHGIDGRLPTHVHSDHVMCAIPCISCLVLYYAFSALLFRPEAGSVTQVQ